MLLAINNKKKLFTQKYQQFKSSTHKVFLLVRVLLLNSFNVGIYFGEIERLSSHPLEYRHHIITCSFKVGSGIIGLRNEYLHMDNAKSQNLMAMLVCVCAWS